MKISLDWIKDYVDIDVPLKDLLDRMAMIGLIAEDIEERDGDTVLDVETYANRPDTLGHLGMAREIAALLGRPLKSKPWPIVELPEPTAGLVDVQILDEDLCPRYCGLVVKGVAVGPSPEPLRRRLTAMGLNPINNVVDVSNLVLFATGQPIHIFDLGRMSGPRVLIRRAKKGERLRLLDGRDTALTPDMLVIADDKKPAALAGIMGGEDSAVSEATRDLFIESANFDPGAVRRTRRSLEMATDASYRFERGVDPAMAPEAAVMAASLLAEFGGRTSRGLIDLHPRPRKPREILLRAQRAADLLGVDVEPAFIERTLDALGFALKPAKPGAWQVQPPSFRVDIEREADLVEEVARFFGYDKIPSIVPPLPVLPPVPSPADKIRRAAQMLFHYGFDEVVNWSFADPEKDGALGSGRTALALRNPFSLKASVLRTTLLGGLLDNTAWNRNRGWEGVHIFETGNIYAASGEAGHSEDLSLALATSGPLAPPQWNAKPRETDIFHLKGAVESALEALRYEPLTYAAEPHPVLEDDWALAVQYKGERIGRLGRVRASVAALYGIKDAVYAAEIDLGALLGKTPRPFATAVLTKFPAVVRDLSFLVGREASFQDIKQALARIETPHLERFEVIDRYAGDKLPPDKVGLSLRFTYRNAQGTLTAEDVDKSEQKIILHLKTAFGMQLREGGPA